MAIKLCLKINQKTYYLAATSKRPVPLLRSFIPLPLVSLPRYNNSNLFNNKRNYQKLMHTAGKKQTNITYFVKY